MPRKEVARLLLIDRALPAACLVVCLVAAVAVLLSRRPDLSTRGELAVFATPSSVVDAGWQGTDIQLPISSP